LFRVLFGRTLAQWKVAALRAYFPWQGEKRGLPR
jgi:hypothetical protein